MGIAPGKQLAKSIRARDAICEATITSLYKVGYAETTLHRVASAAGFSKGALQHHFPSKEDLIAATLDRLLARPFNPTAPAADVAESLRRAWRRHVNTRSYRALMEILTTARTDGCLQQRVSAELKAWGKRLDEQSLALFTARSGDDDDVVMLLNMTRSFMRGLLMQEQYGLPEARNLEYVDCWINLVAPLLELRGSSEGSADESSPIKSSPIESSPIKSTHNKNNLRKGNK